MVLDEDGHAMLTDFGLSKQGMANNLTNSFCGYNEIELIIIFFISITMKDLLLI